MKYLKELAIIFGITMVGELLNEWIPLPVPAGVYGLFLLLGLLCTKVIKLEDVSATGNLLLDMMPIMFVPAAVGLIEKYAELTAILIPFIVISALSTLIVMTVTGKTTEFILRGQKKEEN
ncbi:MAG: CidA/LrgA family protein [Lachnospiraceae bacterium]|nr:CidA/LrgA family protein [Lachnospiraceae bacterium]